MDALQAAIYRLIELYVQRQRLPFEVIRRFRPHLIDSSQPRSRSKEYLSATQIGHWGEGGEWRYFLHGGGCRLTHTVTGEVIDWDAPDLNRFDPYWFVGWLTWFLKENAGDEGASITLKLVEVKEEEAFREKIFDVLEQLCQSGKLRSYPDRTNKYELIV